MSCIACAVSLFGNNSAWQSAGLDGSLYPLGNFSIARKMPVADKGGVGAVTRLLMPGQRLSAPRAMRGTIGKGVMTVEAIHANNYSVVVAGVQLSCQCFSLGNR